MSGLLACYLGYPRYLKSSTTFCQGLLFWIKFFVARLIRLTPAYLILMVAYVGVTPYLNVAPRYLQNITFALWFTPAFFLILKLSERVAALFGLSLVLSSVVAGFFVSYNNNLQIGLQSLLQ
ncbi:hypothetical protein Ciccas_006966 [Cichlidogyrus casuarinus]|uniref:Uncharacterized protein n=1 Tax=Cichlidogyrus casuarinus TaxID=1844966 RepID=A0ABD2Q6R1_9PLAT